MKNSRSEMEWIGTRARVLPWLFLAALLSLVLLSACATSRASRPRLIYSPEAFREALLERVPDLSETLTVPPFEVSAESAELARTRVEEAAPGPDRVRALVRSLATPPPDGFGLAYHWLASTGARRTIASRQGNCVALASVLVGLGRELGWPIYYAVARARRPESHVYEGVTLVADHMVVIVAARSFQMVVDFTGQVNGAYDIRPIDDLTAYAHLINNIAGQRIARSDGPGSEEDWRISLEGFELAARIAPSLGRAWNNQGIALTRLGRFDEARKAYARALELDTAFDSTRRNLSIMQTRAEGATRVSETPVAR